MNKDNKLEKELEGYVCGGGNTFSIIKNEFLYGNVSEYDIIKNKLNRIEDELQKGSVILDIINLIELTRIQEEDENELRKIEKWKYDELRTVECRIKVRKDEITRLARKLERGGY